MASSKNDPPSEFDVQRYSKRANRILGRTTRLRARRRYKIKKRMALKKTPAQRKVEANARATRRKEEEDAVKEARLEVLATAQRLRERFQTHTTDYYYQTILQQSKVKQKPRGINKWNAYLYMEFKRINGGMASYNHCERVLTRRVPHRLRRRLRQGEAQGPCPGAQDQVERDDEGRAN